MKSTKPFQTSITLCLLRTKIFWIMMFRLRQLKTRYFDIDSRKTLCFLPKLQSSSMQSSSTSGLDFKHDDSTQHNLQNMPCISSDEDIPKTNKSPKTKRRLSLDALSPLASKRKCSNLQLTRSPSTPKPATPCLPRHACSPVPCPLFYHVCNIKCKKGACPSFLSNGLQLNDEPGEDDDDSSHVNK